MSDVPAEVIHDIFSRLPVKSLLGFRCLCKSYKSLIDSPKFIKDHLKEQALKPNSDVKIIFKAHDKLFSIDFSSSIDSSQQAQELEYPLEQPYGPIQVIGSCHGLLFISNNTSDNGLWNPSTKMYRKLERFCDIHPPSTPPPQGQDDYIVFTQICGGLGYDSSGDDYKADVWKNGQECPYWLVKEDFGTFAAGALHWIASEEPRGPLILASLNLESERYEQVPYPENLGKPFRLNLAALGECLCLLAASGHVTRTDANYMLDYIDIWMMTDYGVKQSWVKLFTVEQLDGRQPFSYLRPIAYSMTGREVLLEMDNTKFLWYSLEKKSLKHAKIRSGLDSFESFVNLGTLVPLYGGGNEKDTKKGIKEGDGPVIEEPELDL
ncbi:hypothetical protein HAX54_040308 [Datura stramonium]|uniref:F-box domain-containing protein n=1 Tax=Datura stramonium TaxID=4076 RepID=A0ABS8VNS3_DATST|nr:hypothetical protein [Datura stramonium]